MYRTNETRWVQISTQWWQKIRSNSNSEIIFTYHYQNKSSKSCKIVEYQTQLSKQLLAYIVIEKDLRDIIEVLLKYKNFLDSSEASDYKIILKYLMKSIYITYGKLFVSAERRGTRLHEKFIEKKYHKLHRRLMHIRNEYVAHAGHSPYETYRMIYLLPPEKFLKKGKPVRGETHVEIAHVSGEEDITEYREYFLYLKSKVLEKIDILQKNLAEATQNTTVESLYELPTDSSGTSIFEDTP